MSCNSNNESEKKQVDTKEVAEKEADTQSESEKNLKYILFFGNSLTAGYGLEDESESFPSLIQARIDSMNLPYKVVNAGLSGETTAGGNGRINWVLNQPVDIFVLELGGNDMLRGLNVESTEVNLRSIIEKVKKIYPDIPIIIAGMQAPPNLGKDYTTKFAGIYEDLAKEYDAGFIPFLLDGVGGVKSLNLPDGIHPNAEGQKIVRENVWQVLKEYLQAPQ